MPSFLTKVFRGSKKEEKRRPDRKASSPSLLDGKFEAVSSRVTPSPTSATSPHNGKKDSAAEAGKHDQQNGKGKEKVPSGLSSLLRTKSSSSADAAPAPSRPSDAPSLSLNLGSIGHARRDDVGGSRSLGVVFETDPESQVLLAESVIGERRLSPPETLLLVRACSEVIQSRGLETLGIMHPHWYSASPDVQRKLISMFIQSLAGPKGNQDPTLSSPQAAFANELKYTRSPHDVAAVFRWGLRHLKLDGSSFGKDADWYKTFFEAERSAEYSPKAFSEKLVPIVPSTHNELLKATLDVFTSLAAHSEANSISGNKLSMLLGLWMLQTGKPEDLKSWSTFYASWERAGRMLEHLFLAYIRNEAASLQMPRRLTELVNRYPYDTESSTDGLLARPRFRTHVYDALYVHITSELPSTGSAPPHQTFKLLQDALRAGISTNGEGEASEEISNVWQSIKAAASNVTPPTSPGGVAPGLNVVFDDETIRFLNLANERSEKLDVQPVFSLSFPEKPANGHGNGYSSAMARSTSVRSDRTATTGTVSPTSPAGSNEIGLDWAQFSTSGFLDTDVGPLASTLMDKDVEVTVPSRKGSKRIQKSNSQRGRLPKLTTNLDSNAATSREDAVVPRDQLKAQATSIKVVALDEAFIDFWSDALVDPVSKDWPAFIICRVKPSVAGAKYQGKRIEWVVLEQTFEKPKPKPAPINTDNKLTVPGDAASVPLPPSPSPSRGAQLRPNANGIAENRKNRFSFFETVKSFGKSTGKKDKDASTSGVSRKKRRGEPRIGEMGEVLNEEDESASARPSVESRVSTSSKAGDAKKAAAAAVGAIAVGGAAAVAVEASKEREDDPSTPTQEKVDMLASGGTSPAPEAESAPTTEQPSEPSQTQPQMTLAVPTSEVGQVEDEKTPIAETPSTELPEVAEPRAEESTVTATVEDPSEPEPTPTPAPVEEEPVTPEVVEETKDVPVDETVAEEDIAPTPVPSAAADEPEIAAPVPASEPEPESAIVEQPAAEEPVVEEPVVEESVTEEPAVDEPLTTQPIEEVQAEEPLVEAEEVVPPAVEEAQPSIVESEEPPVAASVVEEAAPQEPATGIDEPVVVADAAPEPVLVTEPPAFEEPAPEVVEEAKALTPEPEEPIVEEPTPVEPTEPEPPVIEQPTAGEPAATEVIEEAKAVEEEAPMTVETEHTPAVPVAEEPESPRVEGHRTPSPTVPVAEQPSSNEVEDPEPEAPVVEEVDDVVPEVQDEQPVSTPADAPVVAEDEPSAAEPIDAEETKAATPEPANAEEAEKQTPRIEPVKLEEPEAEADLPISAVPVVDATPEVKPVDAAIPDVDAIPTPVGEVPADVPELNEQPGPENIVSSGSTPAPQVALDAAAAEQPEAEDEKPTDGANVEEGQEEDAKP